MGREFDLPVSDAFLRDLAGCDWASARPVFARYFPADFPLEAVKARHYFQTIVTGYDSDVAHGKPAPDIYQCAAARLHTTPAQCVVVEDSPSGVRAAHAAGAMTALIPDVAILSPEERKMARWIVSSLDQLIPILREEMGL